MWWEFHRLMDLTPEQLVDEDDPIGLLEPVGPLDESTQGQADLALPRSRPRSSTSGAGHALRPGAEAGRPRRQARRTGPSARSSRVDAGGADGRHQAGRSSEPHPAAIVPLASVPDAGATASGSSSSASGSPTTASTPTGPHRAVRDLLLGRPPRAGQAARRSRCARDGETDLDAARRLVLALDRTVLAIQGPPGSGKTYTGARMICTLLAAGDGSASPARATRSSATCSARCSKAADRGSASTSAPSSTREPRPGPRRRPGRPGEGRRRRPRSQLDDGRANLAAGTSWLWASPKIARRRRRPVRRRGRPDLAGQRASRCRARRDSIVLLGDPQQLDQPLQGIPSARRGPLGARPRPRRTAPRCRPTAACSSRRPGGCIPALCAFTSEVFYDDRLEPEAHLDIQRGRDVRRDSSTASGRGWSPSRPSAPTTSRRRGRGGRRARSPLVDGGATWTDAARRHAAARLGGRPHRRAVQRPGRRDRATPAAGGAGRAPSTSSRARRRRSASTR